MHPTNQSENQTSLYGLEESEFQQVIDYGLNILEFGDFDEQKISWENWCSFAKIAIKHVNQQEKRSAQEFFSHMLNELDNMSSEAWVEMEVFPSKLPNNLFIKARKACVNYLQCLDVPNPYSDSGRRENIIANLKQYNSHPLFEQWQEKYMVLFDAHLIDFIKNKEESVPTRIDLQPSDNKLLVEENKKLRALCWKKDLAYSELLQKKNEQNTIPQEESETFSLLMEINTTLNAQLEEQNLAYSELFQKNSELNSQFTEKDNHLKKLNTELELQKSLNTNLKVHLGKIAQETKRTTAELHEAKAQLTDKDDQLRALQAQLDSKDAQLRVLQALLDSKDTAQTLIQAKNINSQEQTQERVGELIPKETNKTEIALASASNQSNKFFDSPKQDSDHSQKLSTENALKPK